MCNLMDSSNCIDSPFSVNKDYAKQHNAIQIQCIESSKVGEVGYCRKIRVLKERERERVS